MKRDTVIPGAPGRDRPVRRLGLADVTDYLAFELAGENYGLPLQCVREILRTPVVTEVPRAARDVVGIVSFRGRITTVIDLRKRLKLTAGASSTQTRVLVVDAGPEMLGLLVDRVHTVVRLVPDEVEAAQVVKGDLAEHVLGIGRPRAGKTGRERGARARVGESSADFLILLDPVPLLRRT